MEQQIDIFPWHDNFNTGIVKIDEQHKKLVQLLNLLARHLALRAEAPALNIIFDELAAYAVYHFQTEESVWQAHLPDDPLSADHEAIHSSFVAQISQLKDQINRKPQDKVIQDVLTYLMRWLVSHILESDRYLALIVLSLQSGQPLETAKQNAKEQMGISSRTLIELMLSIYEGLSTTTLQLIREQDNLKLHAERAQSMLGLPLASEQMDEVTFMQYGQELAENLTSSQIAFIHFVNQDEASIELVTWSRRTIENYCHAPFDTHYPVSQAGIWADALRLRKAVVFNDYPAYTHKHGLPEGHSKLTRLISVPVIENGKVVMLTGVGNKSEDYTDLDIETVQLISNDIWRIVQRKRGIDELRATAKYLEIANQQIEQERALLAQRVLERTAQLQYANKAKDSFLATMSHEIRTPLGGLLGMMELLGMSKLEQEQIELVAAAQGAGHSLLRIVNDILDWSKIEAGKLEMALYPASISEMLKGVSNTYAQIASKKSIYLNVEIDPNLQAVYQFDALRISQILNNFVSNAIKFTAHGRVKISAHKIAQRGDFDTIRFSVQDNGIGMSVEQISRLFQQYEQASSHTARMYGGTGLGLAICQRLADLMSGKLSVESTVGDGSIFSLIIDLAAVSNAHHDAHETSATLNKPNFELFNTSNLIDPCTIKILVVDDHPLNRMLMKKQLAILTLQAEVAIDGVEALAKHLASPYTLIITDCHMPEMDGYELTQRIRQLEKQTGLQRVPIIAWTANALAEETEHCLAEDMDDILTKPTELDDLQAMLVKWLKNAGD